MTNFRQGRQMRTSYRKYDESVINMIIETRNPNLFPELKIPRTTALYWINHRKKKAKLKGNKTKKCKTIINETKKELIKERTKRLFLAEILKLYKKLNCQKELDEQTSKKIKQYSKFLDIVTLCQLSGLNIKKYYILTNQVRLSRTHSNQLTIKEQKTIISLAKRKSLKHLSIKRLQLYAYRKGHIYCNYHTWRKYIKLYSLRDKSKKMKKYNKVKRRITSSSNQLWHIDITEFRSKSGAKIYLQALMDNYSRKILNWTLSLEKSANTTLKTLEGVKTLTRPSLLICDGGGENNNFKVKDLLSKLKIKRIICSKKNKSSNCMIESFFNILKNKYLNKYKRYDFKKLKNILEISIDKYNNSPIPLHNGASANEIYDGFNNTQFLKEDLKSKIIQARIKRLKNKL